MSWCHCHKFYKCINLPVEGVLVSELWTARDGYSLGQLWISLVNYRSQNSLVRHVLSSDALKRMTFFMRRMLFSHHSVKYNYFSLALQILFIGYRGQEFSGDIAVDAISLMSGTCWGKLLVCSWCYVSLYHNNSVFQVYLNRW